jgi:hypothetical protein
MQALKTYRDAQGEIFDVPEGREEAFRALAPEAQPLETYRDAQGELYDVPETERARFLASAPAAERVRRVQTDGGETFDVADGKRQDFLKLYRERPEFEADRAAVRGAVEKKAAPMASGGVARAAAEGAGRGLADAGLSLASGVVSVPQAAVGLLDVVAAPVTLPLGKGGIVGRTVGKVADFRGTKAAIESLKSDEQQAVDREVQAAGGVVETLKAIGRHPSTIAHGVLSSLPSMLGGAAAAQGLVAAGAAPMVAGALGEGAVTAGQMQEETRAGQRGGLTTGRQTAAAVGAGLATAAFAGLANKLAGSAIGRGLGLGANDIETILAGGTRTAAQKTMAGRLLAGAIQEGLLEEFPQSASEKMFGNIAAGRPLMEGVGAAGAQGGVVGAVMGMGGNLGPGTREGGTLNAQRSPLNAQVGTGETLNAQRSTRNAQVEPVAVRPNAGRPIQRLVPRAAFSPYEAGAVPLLNPPVAPDAAPRGPLMEGPVQPVEGFSEVVAENVPLLDQGPLPTSIFAPARRAQLGPTTKAAEAMAINVRDQAAWDAQVAALREAKRNPPPREREVREPGEESAKAKAKRISLKAFIAKDGAEVVHPLLEHMAAVGSLVGPPKNGYKNKGEYDSWRALVKDFPEIGMRAGRRGGLPIDIAAAEFGMEPEQYVEAIRREWMEFKEWRANNGKTDAQLQEEYEADRAEANLTAPATRLPGELQDGDVVRTADGQWRRVDRSETDVVLLRDGTDIPLPADGEPVDLAAHVPAGEPGIVEAREAYREQEKKIWAEAERERIAAEEAGEKVIGQESLGEADPVTEAAMRALGMEPEAPTAGDGETLNAQPSTLNARGETGTEAPAADVDAAAGAAGQSGAVTLPAGVLEGMRRGLRRLGAMFSPNRGVGEQTYGLYNQMQRSLEAARMAGREARNRVRGIVTELEGAHGRAGVMQALREVEEGDLTPAEFSARFGLRAGNEAERYLGVMVRETERMSQKILAWQGRSKDARRAAADMHFYQTRAYLIHALGDGYAPPEAARRAAVIEIEAGLADAVQRLAGRATAVRGKRGGLDVINWLNTGDETFIRHAAPTRQDAARVLRRQWLELRGLIDGLTVTGDHVTAALNAAAAARAADGYVEFYLNRSQQRGEGAAGNGGPGIETAHLRHRFLEGAFRQLYGEITDPAYRAQITREVQARMLAEMTFFERLFAESEGTVWAMQPDIAKGIMEPLGNKDIPEDRKRFGDMAGRFVTREFKELIDASQNKGGTHRVMSAIYFAPMGMQRMGKLLAPKTIGRNYITALTGLALETGDVFLPGYWGAFGEGHKLAVDYARGRPEAIRRVAQLVELGVFQPGASSYTADMQAALGSAGKRMKKMGKAVTEAYTFIDFPTKFAAFEARKRAGMTDKQAAQHVMDMYQNRARTPAVVGKVSRIGLADYLSYTYDSGRMAVNSLKFAVQEAKQGRVLPMFGWITARSIFALASVQATQMLSKAAGAFYAEVGRALRGEDDDDKKKGKARTKAGITPLDGAQLSRMRNLVMPYDAHTPLLAWREEQGGRLYQVGYTIAGGQSAFPLEDIILGSMQSTKHGEGFMDGVAAAAMNMVDEGMYVDAWARAIGGSSFDGKRTPTGKGLWHARPGTEDPQRAQIVEDAVLGWIVDMAPNYPAQMFRDLMRREREQQAGVEASGIFARRQLTNAEIVSRQHRLVRSYTLNRSEMNAAVRGAIRPQMEALERTRAIINQAANQKIEKGGVLPKVAQQAESAQDVRERYMDAVAEVLNSAEQIAPEWFNKGANMVLLTEAGLPQWDALQVLARTTNKEAGTRYAPNPKVNPMQSRMYQQLTK